MKKYFELVSKKNIFTDFTDLFVIRWNTYNKMRIRTSQQGGVVVSRWAHNSKVGGSKPLSATFLI